MARERHGQVTRVVVVAASKGGSGKTTLAGALAARASNEGDVAIIDIDPQRSLARWWELRGAPSNPALVGVRGSGVIATVEDLRREGFDWVFIDTPPALLTAIHPAICAGDLILIPVQPSAFDIEAVEPVVEIARQAARPFAFVVNRVEPRSPKMTEGAMRYLREDGRVLSEVVSNRESFRAAVVHGRSGAETKDDKARGEIEALWKAVKRLAAGGVKSETRK